jgi:hypothetical protein
MVYTTAERAEVGIEEQVARYQELSEQRRILKTRVEKAEAQQRSVNERVFQRVYEDYLRRLQEIESELEPLAAEVQKARASIQNEIREINIRTEEIQDEIDEIAFRYRVGEYDAENSNDKQTPLADEYERLVQRRRVLSESFTRTEGGEEKLPASDAFSQTDADRTVPNGRQPVDSPIPAPPPPSKTDESSCPPERDTAGPDAFIDPTKWVGEFADDEPEVAVKTKNNAPPEARKHGDESMDALSALADPSDDSSAGASAGSRASESPYDETTRGLPILTIVTGPGAGKRLPLLPITMTLGREVDNNIELKDVDVARYHARISFEAGQYTIQDLEGSPGTFVDGQRITKTVLFPGSTIRVGNSELRMELG